MLKKISRRHFILLGLFAFFLIVLGVRFRVFLYDEVLLPLGADSAQRVPTEVGIPRNISYIGRMKEAEQLIDHQYYSLAGIEINEAIKAKPNLLAPYLLLADLHLNQGNLTALDNLIEELQFQFPDDPEITVLQAKRFIASRDLAEAVALFSAENLAPSPHLQFYAALLFALQNDHTVALETLKQLRKLPVKIETLSVTADGVAEVEDELEPRIHVDYAEKAKEVIYIYEEFEEFSDGKMPHLFALIAKNLAENGEIHLAREFATTALKEDDQYVDAWVIQGYAEFMLHNYEQALLDLREAYKLDPIRPETHYFLALVLEKLNQAAEAALFFEKSLENEFEFTNEVKWKLIEIFTKQKKYERVAALYRDVVAENPDPNEFVSVINTSINVLKNPELALEISASLLDEKPENLLAMNLNGWALIANKQFVEARAVLEEALRLSPENPRTNLNMGLLAEQQNDFSAALEWYKKSYDFGKDQPFNSVTNLAAERYNQLLEQKSPEAQENTGRPSNSP